MENKLIGIKSGRNFRELGGYQTSNGKTIKMHKILRSGHLAELDDVDIGLLKNYQLKYDIDFRSKEEVEKEPDRVPEGVQYLYNPVFSSDLTDNSKSIDELLEETDSDPNFGFNNMMLSYEDIVTSSDAQHAYRTFFQFLLENTEEKETLLFHCTAGKDRTGMGAVFLLNALGVDFSTIKQDYLLSNVTTKENYDRLTKLVLDRGGDENTVQAVQALMRVDERYLNHAMNIINNNYGGLNEYTKNIFGMDHDNISQLRNIYLA